MKTFITKLGSHIPLFTEHARTYKHHYLVSILGSFAVIKLIMLVIGIFGSATLLYHSASADFENPATLCAGVTEIPESECVALLELYNDTNGDNWIRKDNRGITGSICSIRYGIQCTGGQVENILMDNNNLSGTVQLTGLSGLTFLRLDSNNLTDIRVSGLSSLRKLYIHENLLTDMGLIGLSELVGLTELSIGNNLFSTIDLSLLTGLTDLAELDLDSSQLTILDLSWLIGLNNFARLLLSSNEFTGINVSGLTGLTELDLYGNQLTTLDISGLKDLTTLNVTNNKLTGLQLTGLTNLDYFYIENNQLTDIDLTGLTGLITLDLGSNLLTTLPESTVELTNLSNSGYVNLSNNCRDISSMSPELVEFLDEKVGNSDWQTSVNPSCPVIIPPTACAGVTEIPESECVALLELYNDTNGDSWVGSTNRGTTGAICGSRKGITCNDGHVVNINLENNNLSGTAYFMDFTQIRYLFLNGNTLTSASISGLTTLTQFQAADSHLTDIDLSGLTSLTNLVLSRNQLTNIDLSDVSNLTDLYLQDNQLTYLEINNSPNLKLIIAQSNHLTGITMTGMTNLTNLELANNELTQINLSGIITLGMLGLSKNQFTGIDLNGLSNITSLKVDQNQLTTIDISQQTGLTSLRINDNLFTGIDLNGFIKLGTLYANDNQITNVSLSGLVALAIADFSDNQLSSIDLTNATALEQLYLQNNLLTGFGDEICGLNVLTNLNVSNNNLSCLPSCFGSLSLTDLNLSSNEITSLPESFTGLDELQTLQIQDNLLTGSVDFLQSFSSIVSGSISRNYFEVDGLDSGLINFLDSYFLFNGQDWKDQYRIIDMNISGSIVASSGVLLPGDSLNYIIDYTNYGPSMALSGELVLEISSGAQFVNSGDREYVSRYGGIFGATGDTCYEQLIASSTGDYVTPLEAWITAIGGSVGGYYTMHDLVNYVLAPGNDIGPDERGVYFVQFLDNYTQDGFDGTFLGGMNAVGVDIMSLAQCGSGGSPAYTTSLENIFADGTGSFTAQLTIDSGTIFTGLDLRTSIVNENVLITETNTGDNTTSSSIEVFIPVSEDCGNGIIDEGETCDGSNFSGNTCGTFGYNLGNLTCSASCSIVTTNCSNTPVTPPSGGGGGGTILIQDVCGEMDCSSSYYDRTCGVCPDTEEGTHNAADDENHIEGSTYSDEINAAYLWSYNLGITTIPNIKQANINGKLKRSQLAKMLVNYADKLLDLSINTGAKCLFTDLDNQTKETQYYAILSCQLGLMGLNSDGTPTTLFNPKGEVTRAQFGTTLSRLLYDGKYNTKQESQRYVKHLNALKKNNIITKIDQPNDKELRGRVMVMLQRAAEK